MRQIILLFLLSFLSCCSLGGSEKTWRITLYSGDQLVRSWVTNQTIQVYNEGLVRVGPLRDPEFFIYGTFSVERIK